MDGGCKNPYIFMDINTRMVKDTRFIKLLSLIPVVDARGK